jgi:benzoylformate decarboxylase
MRSAKRDPRRGTGWQTVVVEGVKDAPGLDLPGLNFEQVATGFGLHATRVSTHSELVDALNMPTDGPRLLNVLIGPAADALY